MQANPFARANMMMAAIAAAMALSGSAQREAMAGIGPYVSRGKGRGKGAKWLGGSTRSKYMPHIGKKERERAKRLYESRFINERFVSVAQFMHPNLPAESCHERSTPTLCQMSKRQYEATLSTVTDQQWSEYESVF